MIVRDSVWLIDLLRMISGSPRIARKFSRTRSNTTILSLIEYPSTDRMPASTVRSNSCQVSANQPATMMMSLSVVMIAAIANFFSKRNEM